MCVHTFMCSQCACVLAVVRKKPLTPAKAAVCVLCAEASKWPLPKGKGG